MEQKQKNVKGFTLIELLIAMFIFTLLMVAASQVFASAFNGYRYTRALQKDVQEIQFAMNLLSKELRTSSIVSPSSGPFPATSSYVQFYDHSQGMCFRYRISNGTLEKASRSRNSVPECASQSFSSFNTVSSGTVNGSFYVTPSDDSPLRVGKVTLSLEVSEGSNQHTTIQTSLSLRDYGYNAYIQ